MTEFKAMCNFVIDVNDCEVCAVNGSKNDDELAKLFAAAPELLEALQRYESFFKSMFAECCSNPVYNTWGKAVDLTLLNEAHQLSESAIKKALGE